MRGHGSAAAPPTPARRTYAPMEPGQERQATQPAPPFPRPATVRPRPPRPPRVEPLPSPVTGRVSPSAAVIARPLLVILPVVTFLVPALLLALTQPPTYTAEARLLVGGFDVRAQAVPGFVEAARTLASTYSRLVETPTIAEPVAEALDLPRSEVDGHISASSVPESSIIRVEGSAADSDRAVELAAAASEALLNYSGSTRQSASAAEELLAQFEEASQVFTTADAERARIAAAVEASASPSAALRQQLALAESRAAAARLRADTLAQRYAELEQGGPASGGIDLVAPAVATGNDRSATIQLAIAAAVGLGLVVGVALATMVVNREVSQGRRREMAVDPTAA